MVELLIIDGHYYMNGQYVGCMMGHSVGPYGTSTGEFKKCKTTSPLNEVKTLLFGEDAMLTYEGKEVKEYY